MRRTKYLEAYLDDYDIVNIYQSKLSYTGESNFFYLEDDLGEQIQLTIVASNDAEKEYRYYQCKLQSTIIFGRRYELISSHGRNVPLIFANIVKTQRFNQEFYYERQDLGVTYEKTRSVFRVWAPTADDVKLELKFAGETYTYEMYRKEHGVYTLQVRDNLEYATYVYLISVNGEIHRSLDPYGKVSTFNSKASVVTNPKRYHQKRYYLPPLKSSCDAIIYEASIRDITKKKTYKALSESDDAFFNLDYISSLGITHVQLLPVLDFKSVDDYHPQRIYNWGYDNYEWMALDNSYTSEPNGDPDQVVVDLMELVSAMHERGLRVNLDVVFNHVFDVADSCLQMTCPYYFFQMDQDGHYSNASMCGNDIDSQMPMCSKYIQEACLYLLNTFDIDGLRFDLMGILDIDTINRIDASCRAIKPDFMVYGEGWNMPSYLKETQRAAIINNHKMPNVAHFSDVFRDTVKGKLDHHNLACGYVLGNTSLLYNAMNCLLGCVGDFGGHKIFEKVSNVINYVECHDNMTAWDQIDFSMDEDDEAKKRRHQMLLAFVILAQGIPFIQGGQEFARSKDGINDTYNVPDSVNEYDAEYAKSHLDIIQYTKDVIALRKRFDCFRLSDTQKVYHDVYFGNIENKMLVYKLSGNHCHLRVIFNPTKDFSRVQLFDEQVIFYDGAVEPYREEFVNIVPLSVIVLLSED